MLNARMDNAESQQVGATPTGLFYGWWVLAATAVQGMLGGGTAHSGFSVFFLPIQRALGINYTSMSLVFSLARAEGGAGSFILGLLADRFGSRYLVLFGGLAAGTGMVLLSLVNSYWQLVLVYVGLISVGKSAGMGQTLMAAHPEVCGRVHLPVDPDSVPGHSQQAGRPRSTARRRPGKEVSPNGPPRGQGSPR